MKRLKVKWLVFLSLILGFCMILYALFVHPVPIQKDYIYDYNSGLEYFTLSMETNSDEDYILSWESFKRAFAKSKETDIEGRVAILYNMGTGILKNIQRRGGEGTAAELETAKAYLKEAGRHDSKDSDIKHNLDILLVREALSEGFRGRVNIRDKREKLKGVIPLPNLPSFSDLIDNPDEEDDPTGIVPGKTLAPTPNY